MHKDNATATNSKEHMREHDDTPSVTSGTRLPPNTVAKGLLRIFMLPGNHTGRLNKILPTSSNSTTLFTSP